MRLVTVTPPTWLLAAMLLQTACYLLVPEPELIPVPWNLVGTVPLLLGIGLNLAADRDLKREQTAVKPVEESSALVQRGAYAVSRHPMYLGMLGMLLGLALLFSSPLALAVAAGYGLFMDRVYIRYEEAQMAEGFGEAWHDYRQRVRRWV